ncbi:MAG TPA: DUF4870 domain-containing protein [Candidatus Binataceae bacterium]|jgi:uncharacterized membrane protein|nr:DUF4870 domain-containing protein [Candidatus Binataceae bacterium]
METLTSPQSRLFGALAYLLFFVSGILLLALEPYSKDDYVRFHARQSIVFSVAWIAVTVVFSVFIAILPGALGRLLIGIKHLIDFAFALVWLFLMYKAYSGERYRLPQLADWADAMGF